MEERSRPQYQSKYTEDEMEVTVVLLNLPGLIAQSEYGLTLPLSWGAKQRRSCDEPSSQSRVRLPSPPSARSFHGGGGTALLGPVFDSEKVEASSPASPALFCPRGANEKPELLKGKASVERTKEKRLEIIKQNSRSNELLREKRKEIKQKRHNYDELKASNLSLQAKKQELSLRNARREVPHVKLKISKNCLNPKVKASTAVGHEDHHNQQPLIVDRTGDKAGIDESHPFGLTHSFNSSSSGLGMGTSMINGDAGPRRIPDLNVIPGEFHSDFAKPVDDDRTLAKAMAAQARMRRMMEICRKKNPCSKSKLRLSDR